MKRKFRLICALVSALCSTYSVSFSAEILKLNVESLFELAEQRSTTIRIMDYKIDESQMAYKSARSERLPDLSAGISFAYLGNGFITDRDFSNGKSIYIPHYGNNLAIEASQIIYSGGAITNGIKAAEIGRELAAINRESTSNDIRFALLGYYLELAKLKAQQKVIVENISLAEKLIEEMNNKLLQGVALKNDITRYELQLSEIKLRLEKNTEMVNVMNFHICNILGFDDTYIEPDVKEILSTDVNVGQIDNLFEIADSNNADIKRSTLTIELLEKYRNIEKSALKPKVALFANAHFDGPITIEVPTINNNFFYWNVGISLSYNISSLYKAKNKISEAKAKITTAKQSLTETKETVMDNVYKAYQEFKTTETEVSTYSKTVELASENYTITSNRYINGMALVTDMIDASNVKLNAEIELQNSLINRKFSLYKLKYLTNTL
ncbi:MAG: TolC family protein [Muribaculaceae bacterium]